MTQLTTQDIIASIDDLVLQKTLSVDAYKGITELKERAAKIDAENAQLKERNLSLTKQVTMLQEREELAAEKLQAIAGREQAVAKREAEVFKHEMSAAVAHAEAKAFRHALGVVFAPNTVRESILKYGSVAQNGMSVPTQDGGTTQRTDGYNNPDVPPGGTQTGDRTTLG